MAKKSAIEEVEVPESKWWTEITDWDGNVVYDGPNPVPGELVTVTPEMAEAGQQYKARVRTAQEAQWEKNAQ